MAKEDKPNLLILLTDDQRLDTLGAYNRECPIQTPNLDRLANDGIKFANGFVTTPICVVSRASILTGRYESNHGVHTFGSLMPADAFNHSYNMLLEKEGYFTGQIGKYGVLITPKQRQRFSYWDAQASQGPKFRKYKGRQMHDAEWLSVKTEEFLDAIPGDKPFCLQVNYKEPHFSSCPAPEDDHLLDNHIFERHPMDNAVEAAKVSEFIHNSFLGVCYRKEFNRNGDHNPFMRKYYEKIVSVERSVGKILDMLEKHGLADNTVIVFLSDHGAHFGEKHLYGKWSPYDASLRIPFIIYDPRPQARKKAVSDEIVLNIDIAPTLLDLAGVDIPSVMDGKSLMPLISSQRVVASEKWRSRFFFEHFCSPAQARYIARNEGIRTSTEKYVHWLDPQYDKEEFYDLTRDPEEANNLIAHPEYKTRVEAARNKFEKWREQNPSTYSYNIYEPRSQALAPEIDWVKFKKAKPAEYKKIAKEVKSLGVTWEQAINDWETRKKIWKAINYYY